MRLLNSCPRLTHLSLTGVAAFQRDDFQPFCRQAPAGEFSSMVRPRIKARTDPPKTEFTQHQRDVFCVFSGNMVSKFRDFLNSAPQFEDVRDDFFSRHPSHLRAVIARRTGALPPIQTAEGEGFDDDMAFEDNDFEGLDPSEMLVDAQPQNLPFHLQAPHAFGHHGPIPVPPPLEPPVMIPPLPSYLNSILPQHQFGPIPSPPMPNTEQQHTDVVSPTTFGTYVLPPTGPTTPDPRGLSFAHASIAGLSQPSVSRQGNTATAGPSTGASTVTMHQSPRSTPEQQPNETN